MQSEMHNLAQALDLTMLRNKRTIPPQKIVLALAFALFCVLPVCAQTPTLAGIAHVAFRVNDLEKSRAFYRTLGFEQAFEFDDGGKTSVAFIKVDDRQFIELYPRTDPSQPGGLLHICFESIDIGAVHDAYISAGLQPAEVKKARAGNLLFVMHDPEGQLLEYTQYLPGSLHSLDRGKHLGEHRIAQHLMQATATVRDAKQERAFYTGKLGFEGAAPDGPVLRIAGGSGDEVKLQPAADGLEPAITFVVKNVRPVARALRSRGLRVSKQKKDVSVTDPDGALIIFTSRSSRAASGP